MWMIFPEGVEHISIERQNFTTEAHDSNGRRYFRVPDHFVPHIQALNMGFVGAEGPPPGCELPDLPKAMVTVAPNEAQAQEIETLRNDLSAANAALSATLAERDDLKLKLHEAEVEISDLKDRIAELEDTANPPAPTSSKK